MSHQHRNDKSPTATLRDPTTPTYSQMRGTPESSDTPSNPWDLMLKTENLSPRPHRLPHFDWTYLIVLLVVAAVLVGLFCLMTN